MSSLSSDAVYDCLSFEGDAIGEAGVEGRPITVVGELGEAGRRKGDERNDMLGYDVVESYTLCRCRKHV